MAAQNVLFFIFRLHGGGAERVVSNLSLDLADKYNIRIAIFDDQEKTYHYKGELIRMAVPFSANPSANNWCARGIRLVVLMRQLRKIKRVHKIDTAISFGEQANIINVLTKGKTKTVLAVRTLLSNEISNTPKMQVLRSFVRTLYNRAHHIVVPSKVAGQDLVRHFNVLPGIVKVIYNYVDQEKIARLSRENIEDPFLAELFRQPVLLNVGRITPAKGQWLLLEIVIRIKKLYPAWKLVIVGAADKGEPTGAQLIARAEQLGLRLWEGSRDQARHLDYDVYLLGFQDNPYRYMRQSSVLLFPSVFEGFPNTLLEAMQTGLPVISADCQSGPREIMAPDSDLAAKTTIAEYTPYGVLCPALPTADIKDSIAPEIIEEWTNALRLVMDDAPARENMIRNGYKRVKDFDRENILRQWQDSIIAE